MQTQTEAAHAELFSCKEAPGDWMAPSAFIRDYQPGASSDRLFAPAHLGRPLNYLIMLLHILSLVMLYLSEKEIYIFAFYIVSDTETLPQIRQVLNYLA